MRTAITLAILAAIAGCNNTTETGDTGYYGPTDTDVNDSAVRPTAQIRFVHLGQGAGALDLFVDDEETPRIAEVGFKAGTDYFSAEATDSDIHVSVSPGTSANPIASAHAKLEGGKAYAVVALAGGPTGGDPLRIDTFEEDLENLGSNMRLQCVHAAGGVGQVDLWDITDPANPVELVPDFDFGESAAADMDPGDKTIAMDENNDRVWELVFTLPDVGSNFLQAYAVNSAPMGAPPVVTVISHPAGGKPSEIVPK